MNKEEIEAMVREALRLAEADRQMLLEDFPDIREVMSKATRDLAPISINFALEEVIYRSLLTGATIVAKKYKEAQRIERELMDSCKSNVKN